jgi:GNAT superfamily N-acetyltransferase
LHLRPACGAHPRPVPGPWPRDPISWLRGPRTIAAWVSEREGELTGHLALDVADDADAWPQWQEALGVDVGRIAVVKRFFVAPDARGRGAGTALLERAREEAATRDLHLALDVADKNLAAIRLYESRGWRRVGEAVLTPRDEARPLPLLLFVEPPPLPGATA